MLFTRMSSGEWPRSAFNPARYWEFQSLPRVRPGVRFFGSGMAMRLENINGYPPARPAVEERSLQPIFLLPDAHRLL